MNAENFPIDFGLTVVIIAVLVFYLRLIILQRERAKRLPKAPGTKVQKGGKSPPAAPPRYSILSQDRRDLVIAGVGLLAMLVGLLLNAGILGLPALQPYWWLPTAAGIVAFSWAFKL